MVVLGADREGSTDRVRVASSGSFLACQIRCWARDGGWVAGYFTADSMSDLELMDTRWGQAHARASPRAGAASLPSPW